MSENRQDLDSDTDKAGIFVNLTDEELKILISDAMDDSSVDLEMLDSLLETYSKRNGAPPVDVSAAWEEFQRDYMGYEETFPYEDADKPTQAERAKENKRPHRRGRMLRYRYVAAILLIAAMLFFVSPASAYFFPAIANWRGGVFWFGHQNIITQISPELESLLDALDANGVDDGVAPTWLPEGFTLSELSISPTPNRSLFLSLFENGDRELIIQVVILTEPLVHRYEMDEDLVESYLRNGIEHHIMMNNRKINVLWGSEFYECAITGDISVDEAKQMINSIYER